MAQGNQAPLPLPPAKSGDVVLAHPSKDELLKIWSVIYAERGHVLPDVNAYTQFKLHERAAHFDPWILTYWILVDKREAKGKRRILAYCESMCREAYVRDGVDVTNSLTHTIGSIFVAKKYRKNEYTSRMLQSLMAKLQHWPTDAKAREHEDVSFLVLYSHDEKHTKFYQRYGWQPFPSCHIEFSPLPPSGVSRTSTLGRPPTRVATMSEEDLLFHEDENVLWEWFQDSVYAETGDEKDGIDMDVAIVPTGSVINTHSQRDAFICSGIFTKNEDGIRQVEVKIDPKTNEAYWVPNHCIAVGDERLGQRMWAYLARTYEAPLGSPRGNTLHILRLVIENEPGEPLPKGPYPLMLVPRMYQLKAIIEHARREASDWQTSKVELWNPSKLVLKLLDMLSTTSALSFKKVDRRREKKGPIPMLFWCGSDPPLPRLPNINWVANESFAFF